MTKRIILILLIIYGIQNISCNKKSDTCEWAPEPPDFFFQIKKDGHSLADSVISDVKIFYLINGSQKYVSDLTPATDAYANKGILTTRQIGLYESQSFYITYPNSSDVDTLEVENFMPSPKTNCQFKTKQVKFNNSIITADSTFAYQPVYVCTKQ